MSDGYQPHYAFVLMGVSGCGKSAVAKGISGQIDCAFLDGDFLHPRHNIEKMAAGQALNDEDRKPWLNAINNAIFAMQRTNSVSIIVCSALKQGYRDILRQQNQHVYFLYLKGDFAIIERRLQARKGHFFKPQMLVSQFATLESPTVQEQDVFVIDIHLPLDEVIANTLKKISQITCEKSQ